VTDSIAAFRSELRAAAERRVRAHRRRRRITLVAAAGAAAAVCTGITVAATGVFSASPAPPEVVADFQSYTPQLGYHPHSGRAQLVAKDGDDYLLYATTNKEGTYCIVTSAPWKRPGSLDDGGTCVPERDATLPIAAGVSAAGAIDVDGESTLVVTGRVQDTRARAIHFASATGEPVERPLGAGGFFIAAVRLRLCPGANWEPTFTALDAKDEEIARASIVLVDVRRDPPLSQGPPVCGMGVAPHGPSRARASG
jgi:hypothetical protein